MKICFYNEGHIGDLLLNLPFIKLLIDKYPDNEYYQYRYGAATTFHDSLIKGVGGLSYTEKMNGDINIPTWMCNKEYAEWVAADDYPLVDHFSVQEFYWEKIYKKHGFDVDIPADLGINYNFLLDSQSIISSGAYAVTEKKKVLIFNQKARSGQADNQDYKSYLVRIANIFDECDFLYTNEEDIDSKLILDNNLIHTPTIFGNHDCDIIHNSYLSLYCDIIIGRANGPFMYAAMHNNNILNKDKVIIGQHNGNDRKDDLEIYFNRSIYKASNIHTKLTKDTFDTLENLLHEI